MNILAIETSCDETVRRHVRDGRHILANVISSQIKLHQQFGGVVPELASREHIVNLLPVLNAALAQAGADLGRDGRHRRHARAGPGRGIAGGREHGQGAGLRPRQAVGRASTTWKAISTPTG